MWFQAGGVFPGPLLCLENVRTLLRAVNHPGSTDKPILTRLLLSTLTSLFAHNVNRYLFNVSLCIEIVSWSVCLSSLCLHYCLFLKKEGYSLMVATASTVSHKRVPGKGMRCIVKVTKGAGKVRGPNLARPN